MVDQNEFTIYEKEELILQYDIKSHFDPKKINDSYKLKNNSSFEVFKTSSLQYLKDLGCQSFLLIDKIEPAINKNSNAEEIQQWKNWKKGQITVNKFLEHVPGSSKHFQK